MAIDTARARELLRAFKFRDLFIDVLGWDRPKLKPQAVVVDDKEYVLGPIAEKRGVQIFECSSGVDGTLPDYATQRKIEKQIDRIAHEHLTIFVDAGRNAQIWQWVARAPGRPAAYRHHTWHKGQSGDALLQKLEHIAFTLDEEEALTLSGAIVRLKDAFDKDGLSKKFYDRFKKEHDAFLKFVTGLESVADRQWYASLMLNRLMFVYFIQKKGFLDGNLNYLRDRLRKIQSQKGRDKFHSFYRHFLLRLFHEGLGKKEVERGRDLEALIGKVPYLNGGLFEVHQLEKNNTHIEIPDQAFEQVFNFFDAYQWHLDDRPLFDDKEINPDVLGYIFEKYINQKEMGAYYTKEDITDYISKNTVVPFLFDAARSKCKVAFENPKGPTVWDLLTDDPDRYIYPAVSYGADKQLPGEIAKGLDTSKPNLIERRKGWNKPLAVDCSLPAEIGREVVARRTRYEYLRRKLTAGEIRDINDLITFNLDIRQFAQDVIQNCEGPELLRAFWHAIEKVTILDPTCGSGAFLFAALNILEPLYEGCLDRMEAFVEDLDRSGDKHRPEKFADFRKVLAHVTAHPNRRYFVFKSIILNNLFGVDIMEEAVEICKLRLFLKLAAQVEYDATRNNLGIEPLPDIDFNIRTGNTLVGFATYDEVKRAATDKLNFDNAIENISVKAADLQQAFNAFRVRQIDGDNSVPMEHKLELRKRLVALQDVLNQYLAKEYGVAPENKGVYSKWLKSYQPFHWFVEFYGIMNDGGFDVIIGNPPYLEFREVDYLPRNYTCQESRAIHAMCMERSIRLLCRNGCMSMIVPLALPSTQRMQVVQHILEEDRNAWYANFAWRPGKLFDTVNRALTIFVVTPSTEKHTYSTHYQKWTSHNRDGLFERLGYVDVPRERHTYWIPKLGDLLERNLLAKCLLVKTSVANFMGRSDYRIYYRTTGGLYWKVFTDFAPAFRLKGKSGHSSRETWITVANRDHVKPLIAALSSDIFWWWYTIASNLRDLNPSDVQNFPVPESALADSELRNLGERYLKDINKNSTMLIREQKQTGTTETQSFKIQKSKPILDEIDKVLGRHYGLTEEELDYIINYDIKYRIGSDAASEDE